VNDIINAKSIYGCRWFKHPIDVVNYENGLENKGLLDPSKRMTCGTCKSFEDKGHIVGHTSPVIPTLSMQGFY